MKSFRIIFWLLTTFEIAAAQPTNHWINFGQAYFKIPVARDGVYRVSGATLIEAGLPQGSDVSLLQLFHRGSEQAIEVGDGGDNALDPSDYILFYGKRNDGTLDAGLYDSPEKQPHRYYNLFSDTTSYFLTVGLSAGKRMQVVAEPRNGLPADAFHQEEKLLVFSEGFNPAESVQGTIYSSTFDMNESWMTNPIRQGSSRDFEVTGIVNRDETVAPRLEIVLVGRTRYVHHAQVSVGASARVLRTVSFNLFQRMVIDEPIAWSDITADGKLTVRVSVPSNGYDDHVSVSYIRVTFRQTTDAQGAQEKVIRTIPNGNPHQYMEIANPPVTDRVYDVTDPSNVVILPGNVASSLNVVIPSIGGSRTLFATGQTLQPGPLKKVRFRQIVPENHDYIIITHPRLRTPAGTYSDPVKAYTAYRASPEGGAYDTLLVHVQDLYDQFNYGEVSPLAIFRFMQFLSVPRPPAYLFLIGKSLDLGYRFHRQPNGHTFAFQDLVPTGGFPGSDMIFSTGINGSGYAPAVSTGRLSAMHPEQVAAYLDKVKEMEGQPLNDLWRKNILHLSGGVEEGEPERFRAILEGYADVASGPLMGAQVKAMAKKSRDLEVINIAEELNKGVAMVTFFGHSSTTSLDFDIGYVSDAVHGYANKGRYPVMLMNGCEAGAFYHNSLVFGENWVYTRDKGAAAFIAHNSYALDNVLAQYSRNFYDVAFADPEFFGKGVGDIQKETARRYIAQTTPSIVNHSQIQQMVLLGDPAFKIFSGTKPDLEIKESQVSVIPYNSRYVTALTDSFAIRMVVRNFGMTTGSTFRISVERVFADNSVVEYDSLYPMPFNVDTLVMVIRNRPGDLTGSNAFRIKLDADDIVDELDEENNTANFTLAIPSNGTRNIFPFDFAIVNSSQTRLSFQSTNLFSGRREFMLQIDTVHTFDSPYFQEYVVEGDVVASILVDLAPGDSTAYYWRTRLKDPAPGESPEWALSSFSYIDDSSEGWAQLHFPQFTSNTTSGLVLQPEGRRIRFDQTVTPVEVITWGANAGKSPDQVSVRIKGAEYNLFSSNTLFRCRQNTLNFVAFDKHSAAPYIGIYLKWYEQWSTPPTSCGREPMVINSFAWNEVAGNNGRNIFTYVDNVAAGDSVLIFSIGNPFIELWAPEATAKLEELGISSAQLSVIASGEPVVILARKGSAAGSATVFRSSESDPLSSRLVVQETVSGGFDSGVLATPLIGPAQQWVDVTINASEIEEQDVVSFDVVGVGWNGVEETIVSDASKFENISTVSASQYPYLRLRFHATDSLLLTPSQLRNWIVRFTPVPEGVLIPDGNEERVVVAQGEKWTSSWRFVNVSDKTFPDSLDVNLRLYNHDGAESVTKLSRILSPLPSDTTRFDLTAATNALAGLNDLQVFVNPRVTPELHFDNNILLINKYLQVNPDRTMPLLDVMFDGRHLLNRDFVSRDPKITIVLRDENPFQLKSDTTGMRILLTLPCETEDCEVRQVWLNNNEVTWTAATAQADFSISFTPSLLTSGEYRLTVEGADAAGNAAAPYTISFRISDAEDLSIIHPHPNPFIDHTAFGFELTGGDAEGTITLDVFNAMGQPVFAKSFSDTHVGKNTFHWDGVDVRGNRLAGGIYPYRISVIRNGTVTTSIGKMVIAR